MKMMIKVAFFSWLAIAAGMAWLTSDYQTAGEISRVVLYVLSFVGGVMGVWLTICSALREDPTA